MLLLLWMSGGSSGPPPAAPVRAYAAISFRLVDGAALTMRNVTNAEASEE